MSRLVDSPDQYPNRCAVSCQGQGPLIDTGIKLDAVTHVDPSLLFHIYLAPGVVQQYAQEHLDMVSADRVRELESKLAELEGRYADLRRFSEAVETIAELEGAPA